MKDDDYRLLDWHRLLFGKAPAAFLAEVGLRVALTYAALTVIVRLLGKRMSAQMTIAEMAVMLTLGAIVAGGMQMPDQGVVTAVIVLLAVVALQRGINGLAQRRDRFERAVNGESTCLVADGVIQLEPLRAARISHEQLFARLREKGVAQLGEVQRVYLEACGLWSVFRARQPSPGLLLYPTQDQDLKRTPSSHEQLAVCKRCAQVVAIAVASEGPCGRCGNREWDRPVLVRSTGGADQ